MNNLLIHAENISARFGNVTVFKNISFRLEAGSSIAITGPNGSGKSTLLQIAAGLRQPGSGTVTRLVNNVELNAENFSAHAGYTGPLVNPYDMLTATENLAFTLKNSSANEKISGMLDYFGLYKDRNKIVKYYSSGMKQRLKLVHAFINDPEIILLDEPGSNLDSRGKETLFAKIEQLKAGRIVIIASNEQDEINLCSTKVELGKQNI